MTYDFTTLQLYNFTTLRLYNLMPFQHELKLYLPIDLLIQGYESFGS